MAALVTIVSNGRLLKFLSMHTHGILSSNKQESMINTQINMDGYAEENEPGTKENTL